MNNCESGNYSSSPNDEAEDASSSEASSVTSHISFDFHKDIQDAFSELVDNPAENQESNLIAPSVASPAVNIVTPRTTNKKKSKQLPTQLSTSYPPNISFTFQSNGTTATSSSATSPKKTTRRPKKKPALLSDTKKPKRTHHPSYLAPPSPTMSKINTFEGFTSSKKKKSDVRKQKKAWKEIDNDFELTTSQKRERLRSQMTARARAANIPLPVTPSFKLHENDKNLNKKPAAAAAAAAAATSATTTSSSTTIATCKDCHRTMDECLNHVLGRYCVKYVQQYYHEHTSTFSSYTLEKQFNIAFSHAEMFYSFQKTGGEVKRTYNGERRPPLCVLNGSYINACRIVEWEQQVAQTRMLIESGEDIDFSRFQTKK